MRAFNRIFLASITLFILPITLLADVLVVSRNTNSVVIFDDSGSFVSSVALPASESEPRDIAQAPNGDIFVLRADATVLRFDNAMTFIESWSAPGQYYGINVDQSGLVYAAGSGTSSVGVYDASGVLQASLTPAGGSNLRDTVKVGTDTWVSNFTGSKIDVIDSGGTDIGDVAAPSAPFGMQLAPNGDVWVVDQNNHEVWRITPAGSQAFMFDADNGPNGAISDQLRYVGVGPDGSVYIPHRNSNIVDVYDDAGNHQLTLTDATLSGPDGILVTGAIQPPSSSALFEVTKTFTNGDTGDVEVTLTCNGGIPLQQSFTISGGGPGVTFTVTDLPDSGANCAVTESGGNEGYTADLSACSWTGVTGGFFSCPIENVPEATTVSVDTLLDTGDDAAIDPTFTTTIECENVSEDTGSNFGTVTVDDTSGMFTADWYADPVNGADCTVTMVPNDMAVEGSTCSFSFAIGDAEAGCDVEGTVFFEGIPTLSQYGMALMALLMLGIGFVGLRRFV